MEKSYPMGVETVSTRQAADALGLSVPTVRGLLRSGALRGELVERGHRQVWRVDSESIEECARSRAADVASRATLASLAARISELERALSSSSATSAPHVIDALTLRAVVAEQAAADAARARVVSHLLAALTAGEEADAHRRAAIAAAETALGQRLIPDDASALSATAADQE